MNFAELRIALVGPVPPPEGGMANQTRQLGELLRREGAHITLIPVNAPYRPTWIAKLRGIRAVFRLLPYVVHLWRAAGNVHVFHIMANSGWSWHLFATPAVWIARMRGIPSVVNYRGGEAETFLLRSGGFVLRTLHSATALVVPSGFLREVFARRGVPNEVVPNIVDLERFQPSYSPGPRRAPRLMVARNLEPIYDIATALRAFALVYETIPEARLTVAGTGPELEALQALAAELRIAHAVDFCGRMDRDQMAQLYRSASVVISPSRIDNMPNSILEAMASGVPIVSTNVGGVPFILKNGVNGLLVAVGDHAAMANAARRVLREPDLANRLRDAALADVQQYAWPRVRQRWIDLYASVLSGVRIAVPTA